MYLDLVVRMWELMGMENDKQYQDDLVKEVGPYSGGWSIKMDNGWSMSVDGDKCSVEPQPGEKIRLYGRGIGYPVRGVVIGNRVYRYQNEADHEAEQTEMRARLTQEREESEARFRESNKPALTKFKVGNEENWKKCVDANSNDSYGFACLQYAARWAALMDVELEKGATVVVVAKKTSHLADTEGITGFMYGCALSCLCSCWVHGEKLSAWRTAGEP